MMPEDITLHKSWFPIFSTVTNRRTSSNATNPNNAQHNHLSIEHSNTNALHIGILHTNHSNKQHNLQTIEGSPIGEDSTPYQQNIGQNALPTNTITSTPPTNPKGIIIRESSTHGKGAFVTQPFKKRKLGSMLQTLTPSPRRRLTACRKIARTTW